MRNVAARNEPSWPFLRLNWHHIARFSLQNSDEKAVYRSLFLKMQEKDLEDGRFKEGASIIDINCRRFPVHDVVNLGPSRDFWDFVWGKKKVKVQYVYDTPIQLTFNEAREEIVELICERRWFSKTQDRESQKQFRERMALCENMHDLIVGRPNTDPKTRRRFQWIGGISFYGEWVG
jgi:hypothetical protein